MQTATRTPCPRCGGRAYRHRTYGASTKRNADQSEIVCRAECVVRQQESK